MNDDDLKLTRSICAKRLYKECERIFEKNLEHSRFEELLDELVGEVLISVLALWNPNQNKSYKGKVIHNSINKCILDIAHSDEYLAIVDKHKQKLRRKLVCRSSDVRRGFIRKNEDYFHDHYLDKQGILLERGCWEVIDKKEVPISFFVPARWNGGRKTDILPQIIYLDSKTQNALHYHLYVLFDKKNETTFSSWEATEYIWRRLEPQIYNSQTSNVTNKKKYNE